MLRRYYSRFPLIDRYTYYYDSQYNLFSGLYAGIVFPLQGLLARSLGATPFMIALICSSGYIGLLLNLLAGHELTKQPKVPYAVRILTLARTVPILMVFVKDAWGFVAISCVMNMFENLFGSAYRSIQKMNYSDGERPRLIGEATNIYNVCLVVSSYAASQIYDLDTRWLRLAFPFSSIFGIFAVWRFAQLKVRYEKAVTNTKTLPDFLSMFRLLRFNKQFLFFMIALFVLAFGNKIGEAVDPFRLRDELKLSYRSANLAMSITMNISQIAGVWFWAKMSKKWNPLWLYMFAGVMVTSRPIALAVATDTFGLIIGMAIFGFGTSGVGLMAILVIFNISHHDSRLSSYLGLYYFLIGVRGLIGPYIGAFMLKHGISTIHIYYVNAVIIGTGAVMIILINVFKKQIEKSDRLDKISPIDLD
jgi:hypothetical protein